MIEMPVNNTRKDVIQAKPFFFLQFTSNRSWWYVMEWVLNNWSAFQCVSIRVIQYIRISRLSVCASLLLPRSINISISFDSILSFKRVCGCTFSCVLNIFSAARSWRKKTEQEKRQQLDLCYTSNVQITSMNTIFIFKHTLFTHACRQNTLCMRVLFLTWHAICIFLWKI